MTNLREVNFGFNKYCGPSVLSILTGESTDRCAAVISAVSGRREIKAIETKYILAALKRLRFDVEITNFSGSTLFGVLHRMQSSKGMYVVFVPHHVIAVEVKESSEIFICDNHTKQPLDIRQSARLMQKVEAVWRVTAKNPPQFLRSEVRVEKTDRYVYVTTYNTYENPDDNTSYTSGTLTFHSEEELQSIISELNKLSASATNAEKKEDNETQPKAGTSVDSVRAASPSE